MLKLCFVFGLVTNILFSQASNKGITPTYSFLDFYEQKKENEVPTNLDFSEPDYYLITHFSMFSYFNNLSTYSPYNSVGTCGFVSLIQVMSYYDSFYNDTIIPEYHDKYANNITTLQQAYSISPGVKRTLFYPTDLTDKSLTKSEFYTHCYSEMGDDFQCSLVFIFNYMNGTDHPSSFQYSIGCWEYQALLNFYYGNFGICSVTTTHNISQSSYRNAIKNYIDAGIPVIVHIKNSQNDDEAHSIVAYCYDDDDIYANYGWGSTYTHQHLLSYSYDQIYYIATLDFSNMSHLHSNNYKVNGIGYCGCNPNNFPM